MIEYTEKASAAPRAKRPQLAKLLADAKRGRFDVVVVWRLDRFARSLQNLLDSIRILDAAGVRFMVPDQSIDTDHDSPIGRFLVQVLGAFAELERNLIVERVKAGVAAAQKRGVHCGRPPRIFRRDEVVRLRAEGVSWRDLAKRLDLPVSTARNAFKSAMKTGAKALAIA